jgi:calpain-15
MNDPQLFCDGIDPNDINQGALGNCWFLASIASVAENPALIKRLFITQEYNEQGIYQLRICKNGEWVKVTVDDYIPCYNWGGPMFCRATGDELWVLLLEKAYAKLHGKPTISQPFFQPHKPSCAHYFFPNLKTTLS